MTERIGAEVPLPKTLIQDHHRLRAGRFVARRIEQPVRVLALRPAR